eukprot:scaffold1181_cov152-Amphora_coffeaeformis.AAC.14
MAAVLRTVTIPEQVEADNRQQEQNTFLSVVLVDSEASFVQSRYKDTSPRQSQTMPSPTIPLRADARQFGCIGGDCQLANWQAYPTIPGQESPVRVCRIQHAAPPLPSVGVHDILYLSVLLALYVCAKDGLCRVIQAENARGAGEIHSRSHSHGLDNDKSSVKFWSSLVASAFPGNWNVTESFHGIPASSGHRQLRRNGVPEQRVVEQHAVTLASSTQKQARLCDEKQKLASSEPIKGMPAVEEGANSEINEGAYRKERDEVISNNKYS